jgi:hypothetical protein
VKKSSGAFALTLCFVLNFATPISAQSPPLTPTRANLGAAVLLPHEVLASMRSMGFRPVSPPALRGRVYVLRAYDASQLEKRVVMDARSGEVILVREAIGEASAFSPRDPHYGRYEPPRPSSNIARATFELVLDDPLFPRQGQAPSAPGQRALATTSSGSLPKVLPAPPAEGSRDAIKTPPPLAPTMTATRPSSATPPTPTVAVATPPSAPAPLALVTPATPGKSIPAPHAARAASAPDSATPSPAPADQPPTQFVQVAPLE